MKIGIIGLGLIGGSVARAARQAGWTVYATDLRPEATQAARSEGVIEPEIDAAQWISRVEALVLTVPPTALLDWLRWVAKLPRPVAVVEMTSVKRPLAVQIDVLPASFPLLSLHPMAGREVVGYENSAAGLFRGHPCAVVEFPGRQVPQTLAEAFLAMMGAHGESLSVAQHDRLVALVSHLPYLASAAVLTTVAQDSTGNGWARLAGTGFRDTTRVGASDPGLWQEILAANREAVGEVFRHYAELVNDWAGQLAAGGWPTALAKAPAIRTQAMNTPRDGSTRWATDAERTEPDEA
ncbi:MAG: prephenate dehydrogenase/arogenate dehydrogenase family protein [Thermaerobacter sp.]|nr:prephenate dehydrogenase/arogenate dehydrogenase family protein [Thermaerobacter sp.]